MEFSLQRIRVSAWVTIGSEKIRFEVALNVSKNDEWAFPESQIRDEWSSRIEMECGHMR
jgi:hypothetical protein